jgi:hypothetical protein
VAPQPTFSNLVFRVILGFRSGSLNSAPTLKSQNA